MKIKIKYFGKLAEQSGKQEEHVELQKEETLESLKASILHKYDFRDVESIQVALNQNLDEQRSLRDGDELAFLPPFAGG